MHVTADPDELGRVYAPALAIAASPDTFARALAALPPLDPAAREEDRVRVAPTTSTTSATPRCRARSTWAT